MNKLWMFILVTSHSKLRFWKLMLQNEWYACGLAIADPHQDYNQPSNLSPHFPHWSCFDPNILLMYFIFSLPMFRSNDINILLFNHLSHNCIFQPPPDTFKFNLYFNLILSFLIYTILSFPCCALFHFDFFSFWS